MNTIPTILKGDDAAEIAFALSDDRDYTGATLVVAYQGVTRTFAGLAAGQRVPLVFTHDETGSFRLGCYPVLARLIGPSGSVETVSNAEWRVKVTDVLAEVNAGGSFAVEPGAAYVPASDVGELGERYTLSDIAAKLNEVVRVLAQKSAVPALAAALSCLAAFGAEVQTARLDGLYNDASVVTNVSFAGLATTDDLASATNGLLRADYDSLTNNAAFIAAAAEAATNYTDTATGNYAAVSNAAMNALQKTGGTIYGSLTVQKIGNPFTIRDWDSDHDFYDLTFGIYLDKWGFMHKAIGEDVDDPYIAYLPEKTGTIAFDDDVSDAFEAATNYTDAAVAAIPQGVTAPVVTNIVRDLSLGGIWDEELEVWWTPVMRNGSLTYQATTNVNLNAEN